MEIQGKYVKNMRKYKGTIIVLIVCMIFAYLYAHVDKKEYFYNRTVDVGKYSNTGVICEKKLTQDVYSTEKSLDGIQVKTQNVGDCTNIKIKITILDKKTKQNLRQKEISVSDAYGHFPRPSGPRSPARQGHIKRPVLRLAEPSFLRPANQCC